MASSFAPPADFRRECFQPLLKINSRRSNLGWRGLIVFHNQVLPAILGVGRTTEASDTDAFSSLAITGGDIFDIQSIPDLSPGAKLGARVANKWHWICQLLFAWLSQSCIGNNGVRHDFLDGVSASLRAQVTDFEVSQKLYVRQHREVALLPSWQSRSASAPFRRWGDSIFSVLGTLLQ
jgi:hypothetical protein